MPLTIYCTAALISFSNSISYITYLFSGWRIQFIFLLAEPTILREMTDRKIEEKKEER